MTGPDRGGWPAWVFTRGAVWRAGGSAVRLTPDRPVSKHRLDGLILGGGADVDPSLYGSAAAARGGPDLRAVQRRIGTGRLVRGLLLAPLLYAARSISGFGRLHWVDARRDQMELALLALADRRELPVLGICRGAQLMNVHAGGTLDPSPDAYSETPQPWTPLPRKTVRVVSGTLLRRTLDRERCMVNSLHRQAIARVGKELTASAFDASDVIQGIEHSERPFWLGVQWHPEYLPQSREQQALFSGLVSRAARTSGPSLQATASELPVTNRGRKPGPLSVLIRRYASRGRSAPARISAETLPRSRKTTIG